MARIDIGTETEGNNHWDYDVSVVAGGATHRYTVRLGWSDYDLWSRGRVAPERVVRAAFEFLLERQPAAEIRSRFDCSVIRRHYPEVDRELPRRM